MKKILTVILLFGVFSAKAQTFSFPKLPVGLVSVSAVKPENWRIIDVVHGDLNSDNLEDLAIVLESNVITDEKRAYGDADTELIKEHQKPRILAIYFKNTTGKYTLTVQNNDFILRAEEGGKMGDPFKKVGIANNKLLIAFEGGANWRWKLNYQFKYLNKQWLLVQANNTYYHAVSGEMTDKKYDFTTKKVKETEGNLFINPEENKTTEKDLKFTYQRTFLNFKKPWTWQISEDNFL